jgi:hypothetical protein
VIEVCVDFRKLQHFSHHQQHDQATVGVYGQITYRSDIVERTELGGNNGLWDCYRGLLSVQYLMHGGLRVTCLTDVSRHTPMQAGGGMAVQAPDRKRLERGALALRYDPIV